METYMPIDEISWQVVLRPICRSRAAKPLELPTDRESKAPARHTCDLIIDSAGTIHPVL